MKKLKEWYLKKDIGERARFISSLVSCITIFIICTIVVVAMAICIDNIVGKIVGCVSIAIICFFAIVCGMSSDIM